jgi:hypothetical protein
LLIFYLFSEQYKNKTNKTNMEPKAGFEPATSSLPRMRSTPELLGPVPIINALQITNGAGDEARTRDIQLGRLTLYQLSYSRNLKAKG